MQLKTVSSLGLAFLLIVGAVGVASAQEVAGTQGIFIRVVEPAANTWATIGDTIEIRILCYDGTLDDGVTVAVADSGVADTDAAAGKTIYFHQDFPASGDGFRDGTEVDTFTVKFAVDYNADHESANDHSVKVVVQSKTKGTDPLNNLMTDKKITPATAGFGATRVGDGVLFGIDGARPLVDGVFEKISLDIDPEAASTDTNDMGAINRVMINTGDEVKITLELNTASILNVKADRIEVGIVPSDSITDRADPHTQAARAEVFEKAALVKFTLRGDKLYIPAPSVSGEIEAGTFADNQRVEIFAYLVDLAGNVGGDNKEPIASDWKALHGLPDTVMVSDVEDLEIVADATAPTITVDHPNPDSIAAGSADPRISADTTQTLTDYTLLPGEMKGVQTDRVLSPIDFKLSEFTDTVKISHGDSSFSRAVAPDSTVTVAFPAWATDPDSLAENYEAAGGTTADLTIEVTDSLGNTSSLTIEDITLDGNPPKITNLFPTNANAPKDADNDDEPTINIVTKDPSFQINEELDSLSIRYHEAGGGTAIEQGFGPGNVRLEQVDKLVTWPVGDTTFVESQRYELEVVAFDLAGNASVEKGETLTFTKGFMNPNADEFKIVDSPDQSDKVVAGVDFTMRLSVLDTMLSRIEESDVRAVTYHTPSALAVIVSGDQAAALDGVTFGGTGVSAAPSFALPAELAEAGMVARAAILDGDGWHAGQRDVTFKSEKPLSDVTVMAAEGSIDPATGAYTLRISGELDAKVTVEVAELSKFVVTAMENNLSSSNVAGAFTVNVLPTDAFGNASMKQTNTVGAATYESVAVNFSTSNIAVTVPTGQQMVAAGGTDFGALAADLEGSATITVRTSEATYTVGDEANQTLAGSVTVTFAPEGGPGPDPGAPAAVASVTVQDYMGADGQGDEGGMVMISFPNSSQHEGVVAYQIWREVDVTTGLDDEGNMIELEEPVKQWVSWTSIGFAADSGDNMGDANGDMQRAVVPAIDNVATNWGVVSVGSAGPSDRTTASKRVFTKESIRQTLQLLGMPEAELLTEEELSNQFNAPEDYVKALIGDRKNVIFAPVNPDVSALMGGASVPANIRTAGHATAGDLLLSARTVTEEPVAAVDNIAPAAVTDASGDGAGGVVLRWTASANDGMVGSIPYRGYSVPILGVKGYRVMRGASADALEMVATLAPGSTRFTDDNLPDGVTTLVYRIDAYDDNNVTMGQAITVADISIRMKFADADGNPVYLMVLPSQGGDLEVNFEDFVVFAAAFNSRKGDANYNPQADVNDDGAVDFSDYVTVVATFGHTAVPPAGSKLAVAPQRPGVNPDTEMTLELTGEKVLVGETISVTVSMANARALNGYGLELAYDADKFEFVSAVPAENDLLKSEGDETPLFKNWPEEGRVSVVNAIIESGSVSGEGALVTFTFKVLREFEDVARFEIARGVVFDADQLQNPVVTLGALDVQSTPTEFALHQNYPNPFNPQTNIPYDLAEGGDVVLRIYNLLGQEVRTLVRERQAPGRYTVQWSGTDDRGVSVSSGIYFYQVSVAGKFQDAKRLMLLK